MTSYFVRLSFEDVPDLPLRRFLNRIPTSFALDKEQVERLIATRRICCAATRSISACWPVCERR